MEPYAFETLTIAGSATALTAATYGSTANDSIEAVITVETASARYRIDGSNPTASVGHLLLPGDSIRIAGLLAIQRFRAIRTGSTSSTFQVTYER